MKAIIAINNTEAIGLNGRLPWYCPEDLKHFQKLTANHIMIAGTPTFNHMLEHVDLTKGFRCIKQLSITGHPAMNKLQVVEQAALTNNIIIVGGLQTYTTFAPFIKEWHVSIINDNTKGDTHLPVGRILHWAMHYNSKVKFYYFDAKQPKESIKGHPRREAMLHPAKNGYDVNLKQKKEN